MAVTENPLIIMMINMTVVFLVLISLIFVIKFIHMIDPTKPKETPAEVESGEDNEPLVAAKSSTALSAPEPESAVEEGVTPEIIAAISAAIAAYGFAGQVRAVRIINHEGTPWRSSARFSNLPRK